jgi:hypothetical protein
VLKDGQNSENSSPAEPNSVKEPEISVPDQEVPSK